MKTINESPYDFFQQGGWSFLGGSGGGDDQSESDQDETESEFEADTDDLISEESEASESDYSDASDDSGSASSFDDDSSGDDWDELEKKAAKCKQALNVSAYIIVYSKRPSLIADRKRAETGRGADSDESDDDRPKKKKQPAAKPKANGKAAKR